MTLSSILLSSSFNEWMSFGIFLLFITIMLSLDLGLFNKNAHEVKTSEAAGWTVVWVSLATGVYVLLYNFGYMLHGIEDVQGLTDIQAKYHQPFKIVEGDLKVRY